MLSYDDLVDGLEEAWIAAGLHEHALIESIQPGTHDRSYRAELFPEHGEPLTEDNMPPWVEVHFSWTAAQQLRAEGRPIESEPVGLIWNYMVQVRSTMYQHSDQELVRLFQRAVHAALRRFYPGQAEDMGYVAVEVRRIYQSDPQHVKTAYVQLMSTNITDLSELWDDLDPMALHRMMRTELQLANAVIQALADVFSSGGNGGYRSVDAA